MQRIGKYEIKDKVGAGGFGQVYRALDPTMGRMVAIKFLTSAEPDTLKRFRNEAAAAGKLRHKNIVTVYEFGEQDGVPYIVMELMDGEDLHRVISKRRPITIHQKVRIMMETAEGLHHAHANGVVHRDVKPANIMLLNDGSVKIMDFGIALVTQDTASRLTPQGSMLGTFRYMAPDQFYGMPADPLCDIFSYGIIFYELFAYVHPFYAQEPAAVMRNITQKEPEPLRRLVPDCPEALEAIVTRLLSKEREQRYQTLDDVHYDLAAILLGLERERSAEILTEARNLIALDDLSGAQTLVRQVLNVDPAHTEARELRESLQQHMQRKSVRPRVESLLKAGREELAAGRHSEAIQNFESAWKLDRANTEIWQEVEKARALMERSQATARLLGEARAAFGRKDFAGARKAALELLRLDGSNQEASDLMKSSHDAAQRQERELQIEEAMHKAQSLAALSAYDDAQATLDALGSDAGSKVRALSESIQARKDEAARRHRLQTGLAAAADMLSNRQFEESVSLLENLRAEFPNDQEVAQYYQYGRRELDAERRVKAVQELVRTIESLTSVHDFAGALPLLEDGLQRFPDDASLLRLKTRTLLEKTARERQQGIEAVIGRCQDLETKERLVEALQVVQAAIAKYGIEPALQDLEQHLKNALDRQRRAAAVRKAVTEANRHLEQGLPENAIPPMQEALAKYPGEAELTRLLTRAEEERARAIQAIRREVSERAQVQDFDRAISLVEQGLGRFPGEAILADQLDSVKRARAAWQRQQTIDKVLSDASSLASEKRFQEALDLLSRSLKLDDQRIQDALARIQQDSDAHQKRAAVGKAANDARALLKRSQPRDAIHILREVLARYRGERELEDLLARAEKDLAEQERAEIVERVTNSARGPASRNDYDGALQVVTEGLQQLPGDQTLLSLQGSIRSQQTAWKRQQAVLGIDRQATQLAQQGKLAEAVQVVGKAVGEFAGEPVLTDLQRRLEREWEQQKRAAAVSAATAEATALIDSGRIEDALRFLAEAAARYPGERAFEALRTRIEAQLEARRQCEQIGLDANALLAAGRADEAVRLLREGLSRYPGDAELSSALHRAETEMRARQRAEGVQKAGKDARALAAQHEFDRALSLLDDGIKIWPGEPSLLAERKSIVEAKAAWQREQALQGHIAKIEGCLREKRISQGLKAVGAALREFPDNPALAELQRHLGFREAVERISALIDSHRPDEASRLLTQLLIEHPSDPELQALAARAENEQRARQRSAAIEKLASEARARIAARDFDGSLVVIDRGLAQYPNDPALTALRQEVAAAKAAWQLEDQRRQARERDLAELQRLTEAAQRPSRPPELEEMLQAARKITGKHPGDTAVQAAATPVIDQILALQNAAQQLANQNFAEVLAICARFLAIYPAHAGFSSLRNEATTRQRGLAVQELLRRVSAETNLDSRIRLLSEGLKQYPDEAALQQEFQVARKKLDLVNSIRAKAESHEKAGQWDDALNQWTNLAAIEKGYPGLEANLERIRKKRDDTRSAAIAQCVKQVDDLIKAADLAAADRSLAQALGAFPDAAPLKDLSRRLGDIKQRKEKAGELLAQGQSACDQGRFADGKRMLREAFELNRDDADLRKKILKALLACAKSALRTDWRAAESLLQEAGALDGGFKAPADLVSALAEQKQNDTVAARVNKAGQLRASGDFKAALGELGQGLAEYPSDQRLKHQRDAIDAELRAWREKLAAELQHLREKAKAATDPVQIDPLLESARAVAARAASDTEMQAAAGTAIQELTERRRQLKSAALWAGLAARRKPLGYIAAAAVVVTGAFFGVRTFLTPPALIPLAVTASPASAKITAGGQVCTVPCELHLKAGSYSAEARLEGYQPATRSVTLDASHHEPLNFSLTPLPLAVNVNTNFSSGSVSVDGKAAGSLKNGQLSLESLPYGEHEIAVNSPEGGARVKFRAAEGQLPTIVGAVSAQNSDAVAIGNLGKTAKLSSAQSNETVAVDGKSSGVISPGGLEIPNLVEGNRELTIGQRSLVMSVRPEPSLTLVLTSDRNVGSLIVETGSEDNATVGLNGKTIGQTSHGILRIPLDVASAPYVVRVEKKGYRVQPPELAVRIRKGEEAKAAFRLEPIAQPPQVSKLNISGAVPGTRVLVDGVNGGEIGPNGSFTASVKPGDHEIELTKDGYSPKRIRKTFAAAGEISMAKPESELAVLPPDPRQVEEQDWDRIRSSKTASDFDDFLHNHPNGAHAAEARSRSAQILQQSQAEAARQAEQTAWDSTDKTNKAALQAYLSRFGSSAHAQLAHTLITGIEKQEADALAAAQLAREQQQKKLKEAEHPQVNTSAVDQQSITQTIGAFEAAYNRMDLAALQTLWSGMAKSTAEAYREQFRFAKSVVFHLQPLEPPSIAGDSATVNCTRSLSLTLKSGPRPPAVNERVRVTLSRAGSGWVIRAITSY